MILFLIKYCSLWSKNEKVANICIFSCLQNKKFLCHFLCALKTLNLHETKGIQQQYKNKVFISTIFYHMSHFVKICPIFEWWCCPQQNLIASYNNRRGSNLYGFIITGRHIFLLILDWSHF